MEKQALVEVIRAQNEKLNEILDAAEAKKEEYSHLSSPSVIMLSSQIVYTPMHLDKSPQAAVLQLALGSPAVVDPYQTQSEPIRKELPKRADPEKPQQSNKGESKSDPVDSPAESTQKPSRPVKGPDSAASELALCDLGCGRRISRSEMQQHNLQHRQVRASYDYMSVNSSMLSFKTNCVISSVTKPSSRWFRECRITESDDWLFGELDGWSGGFPSDRVEYVIQTQTKGDSAVEDVKPSVRSAFKQRFGLGKKKADPPDLKGDGEWWFSEADYVVHDSGVAFIATQGVPKTMPP